MGPESMDYFELGIFNTKGEATMGQAGQGSRYTGEAISFAAHAGLGGQDWTGLDD